MNVVKLDTDNYMNEIKSFPEGTMSFIANGKTYYFQEKLSINRYWQFQRFRVSLAFKSDPVQIYNTMLEYRNSILDVVKDSKNAFPLIAKFDSTLKSINEMNKRPDISFWICTLFFNTADEDVRYWTNELAEEKIKDWEEEGIDSAFFLQMSIPLIQDFIITYKQSIQSILEVENEMDSLIHLVSTNPITED